MLDQLTVEDFQTCLESTFRLSLPGGEEIELRLAEAIGARGTPSHREPFSLLFQGPAEPVLPQAIYPLHHHRMGELGLFLVPVGPSRDGMQYESIFT